MQNDMWKDKALAVTGNISNSLVNIAAMLIVFFAVLSAIVLLKIAYDKIKNKYSHRDIMLVMYLFFSAISMVVLISASTVFDVFILDNYSRFSDLVIPTIIAVGYVATIIIIVKIIIELIRKIK